MKELSIEEKARAYDKVREKIAIRFGSNVADEIFSQFEMSEDERIRKEIISTLKFANVKGFLHNQVKENCSTLWIARDFDGALAVFTNKPVLTKSKNRWIDLTDKNDFFNVLPEYYYPKVTFENSPLQLLHL